MGDTPPVKRPRRGMPAMPKWELETPPGLKRGLGSPALFGIVQGVHRGVDLLRARARRPGRARLRLDRLPVLRPVLRARRPVLRRGRLAAPGARRRDDHRALRLQRAVELHRRLGDPARLHPADRADRVRDDRLRGGAVPAARGRAGGVPVRRRGRPRRRLAQHPRRRLEALRALLLRRARRPRPADDDRDPRAGAAAQPRRADRPGEHRGDAVDVGPDLRLHADARDVRGRRRVVGPRRRGQGRPPRAQAPRDRPPAGLHPLRRHRARGGQRAAGRQRAALGRGQLRRRADARRRRRASSRRG